MIWREEIMANHDIEVENKVDFHDHRTLKTRLSNKKAPDFSSSTLRRIAFMENGRTV
jgi:hypothetical protein